MALWYNTERWENAQSTHNPNPDTFLAPNTDTTLGLNVPSNVTVVLDPDVPPTPDHITPVRHTVNASCPLV